MAERVLPHIADQLLSTPAGRESVNNALQAAYRLADKDSLLFNFNHKTDCSQDEVLIYYDQQQKLEEDLTIWQHQMSAGGGVDIKADAQAGFWLFGRELQKPEAAVTIMYRIAVVGQSDTSAYQINTIDVTTKTLIGPAPLIKTTTLSAWVLRDMQLNTPVGQWQPFRAETNCSYDDAVDVVVATRNLLEQRYVDPAIIIFACNEFAKACDAIRAYVQIKESVKQVERKDMPTKRHKRSARITLRRILEAHVRSDDINDIMNLFDEYITQEYSRRFAQLIGLPLLQQAEVAEIETLLTI